MPRRSEVGSLDAQVPPAEVQERELVIVVRGGGQHPPDVDRVVSRVHRPFHLALHMRDRDIEDRRAVLADVERRVAEGGPRQHRRGPCEAVRKLLAALAQDVDREPAGRCDHRVDGPLPADADEHERRVEGQ